MRTSKQVLVARPVFKHNRRKALALKTVSQGEESMVAPTPAGTPGGPAPPAGSATPAAEGTPDGATVSVAEPVAPPKPGGTSSRTMKMAVLIAVILGGSGYLSFISWTRTTPLGSAGYIAEMKRDIARSDNEVAIWNAKVKLADIELQQARLEKQR